MNDRKHWSNIIRQFGGYSSFPMNGPPHKTGLAVALEWADSVIKAAEKCDQLRPPRSLNPDVEFAIALDELRATLKAEGTDGK